MNRLIRILGAALVAIVSFGGCVKFEQAITLMPDGSGKMVLTISMQNVMKQQGGANFKDPDTLDEATTGIVAFTMPTETVKDDWTTITVTAYFDDINKVKLNNKGQGEALAFELKKTEAGSTLVVGDHMSEQMTKMGAKPEGAAEMAKEMTKMVKEMIKGLSYTLKFTVPGAITTAEGWTKNDRTASLTIDEQLIGDSMDGKEEAAKKLEELKKAKSISWAKATVSDADVDAFKKELAKAKEEWKGIREELKKKAAEQKDKAPETPK